MFKKIAITVFILLFSAGGGVFLLLTGKSDTRQTITDKPPQRIVSLAPNVTEILFALGAGDKVVGVSNNSDYPEPAKKITRVGTFWKPDTETVVSLEPELVITLSFSQQKQTARTLESLGYNVLTLEIEKIPDLYEAIKKIADAAGCSETGERLAGELKSKIAALESKYKSESPKKVLWVIQNDPIRTAGRETFINRLIEIAGGENIVPPSLQKYPSLPTEELLARSPEVIIHSAATGVDVKAQRETIRRKWEKWRQIPAVKNKRIYIINPDTVQRLGPRLPSGIKTVARCLHNPGAVEQKYKIFADTDSEN